MWSKVHCNKQSCLIDNFIKLPYNLLAFPLVSNSSQFYTTTTSASTVPETPNPRPIIPNFYSLFLGLLSINDSVPLTHVSIASNCSSLTSTNPSLVACHYYI